MMRIVLDAGTLLSWFTADGPGPGRAMRADYEAGSLTVVAPRGIVVDALALLAQRPGWAAEKLERVGVELARLGFELRDPPPAEVVRYLAKGLPADRAAYPALAASLDLRLRTDDPELKRVAAPLVLTP